MAFTLSRAKLALLFLVSLAGACRTPGDGGSAERRRGEPLELGRLQIGSVYGIGSRFESDGLEFSVDGFGQGLGNAEVASATEAAAPAGSAKPAAVKTLRLSHATLRCRGKKSNRLEFDFTDNGGPVGLDFAGATRSAANFIELDGIRLGSARIAVSEANTAGVRRGRVVVSGALGKFAISGADLEVADVRLSRD